MHTKERSISRAWEARTEARRLSISRGLTFVPCSLLEGTVTGAGAAWE